MPTSFVIQPGYQSGALKSHVDAWDVLRDEWGYLMVNQYLNLLDALAHEFGFDDVVLDTTNGIFGKWVSEYLLSGATVRGPDEEYGPRIAIGASGPDPSRKCKEAVALAVCQVLFYRCAKQGVTICIEVT